eukprot:Phypoly_transcript_04741.p1 GENE.Phypoly_transcript_04741~~Phypoly_transcript_04741.p1  ORF type:complete len:368 (+),score=56.28 Phypoly_transcript_04741:925-2028(+)
MEVFPLIFPEDALFTSYFGFIPFQGGEYKFKLQLGENKNLKDASIFCSPKLKTLLKGHEQTLKQRLAQSVDLEAFMLELKNILDQIARTHTNKGTEGTSTPIHMQLYSTLVKELQEIGWDQVVELSPDLSSFKIRLLDSANREHVVSFKVPADYPASAPTCHAQFPVALEAKWGRSVSLLQVLDQWKKVMEDFQEFWNEMENLDKHTWVLEPEHPNPAATTRRIAIGNHCSIQIEVDPYRPRALPECRFWGSDSFIAPLRQEFNKNIHLWDTEARLLENMQKVLAITFPSPQTSNRDEFLVECAICYAYRNEDGAIPDRVCDFAKCSKPFHRVCLFNWLKDVPTSRQSFGTIFGTCPNCRSPISVAK